jgi:hypothetical protein
MCGLAAQADLELLESTELLALASQVAGTIA